MYGIGWMKGYWRSKGFKGRRCIGFRVKVLVGGEGERLVW